MKFDQIKLQMIFDAACQMPTPDRDIFLNRECVNDDALRVEIESLLDHYFTQAKTIDSSQPSLVPIPSDAINHIPERWKIGSGVESGGMGSVYDARDKVLDRRVANDSSVRSNFS